MIPELYICHCLELCSCHDKFVQLLKERDEALARAEAYRKLAAEFHLNGTTSGSQFAKGMAGYFEVVDAEAARIMKEKGGV